VCYTYIVRTRQTLPNVKQRRLSKYEHLIGSIFGTRLILQSLPRSLFEVQCVKCDHFSVQRGIDLDLLKTRECQNCKVSNRDPNLNAAFLRTRGNAKVRDIEFSISKLYYESIAKENCHYCDTEPAKINSDVSRCLSYNGLDRIDSSLGYVEGNVVSCCKYCNYAKHDMSVKDFKDWLTRCYSHTILTKESN
jgi:hypothetical protein